VRAWRGGRHRGQRPERVCRLLAHARQDPRGVHRRRVFPDGRYGECLPNGYLRIVGRAKDLIITGGLNVYPKEIEEKIDALSGVVESAVIGVPDADFGEAVAAVVVAHPGHALTEAGVIEALQDEIARFKIPKRVQFVAELPRNTMGKVQKNVLRERFAKP
jgi:malonyl-CoA/methylmalonyl-CoA synthetase